MNKKETKLPLSLARILLNVPDHEFRPTSRNLSEMVFDQRHDFILTLPSPMLAIRMEFANELALGGKKCKGIRRPMTVTLSDATTGELHVHTTVSVYIRSGRYYDKTTVCLPIDYNNVNFPHPHTVTVRDNKSGQILGEQTLHFFRPFQDDLHVSEWLKPVSAGVVPDYSEDMYRSFDADVMSYHNVRLHLEPDPYEEFTIPPFFPEMEVRIYFPDGSIDSKFIVPARDKNNKDSASFIVSSPFYMTTSRKGICYAELICDDIPIAGIVFCTDGDPEYGPWRHPCLEPLDEYSLENAVFNYKCCTAYYNEERNKERNNAEPEALTDEDFENALEEFISSEQEQKDDAQDENPDVAPDENSEVAEEVAEESPQPDVEEYISPLKALEHLTGLKSVKEKLSTYEKLVMFNKRRKEIGMQILSIPLHAMFLGSPGTGKTTVAKHMGIMLRRAGLLSKGHVVVKERASLMGIHYGDQEVKTLEALEEAQGGILLIDEAYQLFQPDDPRDPGKIVIDSLLTALADDSNRDWMLILAGYPKEIMRMFDMNPGLKSRITDTNIYIFDDFNEAELMEIAERYLERNQFSLTEAARDSLSRRLACDYLNRDKTFGNARHVINMIQAEIIPSMASRVAALENPDAESLSLIQPCDIPAPKKLTLKKKPKIGYCA